MRVNMNTNDSHMIEKNKKVGQFKTGRVYKNAGKDLNFRSAKDSWAGRKIG